MNKVLGFITLFAGDFAPNGWAFCDGSLLRISLSPDLFSVIGTTYGGDGVKTFALPDLRGRAIIGAGQGASLHMPGEVGGIEKLTLKKANLPAHTHDVKVTIKPHAAGVANSGSPKDAVYATNPNQQMYGVAADVKIASYKDKITTSAIGSPSPEPISVLHPVLALNYIICLKAEFPNRNQ